MLENIGAKVVRAAMKEGKNCCEAVLLAGNEVFNLKLNPETLAAGNMFQEGMASGCTCGALVGMVMVSGILHKRLPHPLGNKLSSKFHDRFKAEFGSTCCRVIRKSRPILEQFGKKACIDLSAKAAEMLVEEWQDLFKEETLSMKI